MTTQDNFEFIEIANPTKADVDLAGYTINYNSVTLTVEADSASVVPAGESLALWLRYKTGQEDGFSSGSPNSFLFDDADLRAHYGVNAGTPIGHLTGQAGMADDGGRSLSISNQGSLVANTTYLAEHVGPELSGHYAAPAAGSTETTIFAAEQTPTPGSLQQGQLVIVTDPEPEPDPGVPEQGPPPATDPQLKAPMLQVTEVAPDTNNVDGADAYEFVAVYNYSDAPIDFADFTLNYLYIDANAVTTNAAAWPSKPCSAITRPSSITRWFVDKLA